MRRSVLFLTRLIPLGLIANVSGGLLLAGCEDGPNQVFSPSPAGAGDRWNNAGPDASTSDPGAQNFEAGGGGTNAVNICTAAEQNEAWSKAFTMPIVPPFSMGGLDLSTGGTFDPFTIEDAERGLTNGTFDSPRLCQGSSQGVCNDGSGNPAYAWGPSGQFYTCYDIATHQLTFFTALPGFDGKVTFKLPQKFNNITVPAAVDQDGHAGDLEFVWQVGSPITENSKVMKLGWTADGVDPKVANKLYLALMYTFQPTLIAVTDKTANPPLTELTDPNYDCLATAKCRTSANNDSSQGNFGVRPVGVYFDAAQSQSTDPATAGSPSDIYMYPVKFVPYSLAAYSEGLDTFASPNSDPSLQFNGKPIYGPYSPAGVLSPPGSASKPFCTLYMGESWGDFVNRCVNVSGDSKTDNLSLAKLLGAQHHTQDWYSFSVVGVNQNFSADTVELTDSAGNPTVLSDSQGTLKNPPHDDDVATDFIVDVRASGAVLNDMRGDSSPATTAVTALDKWEDANTAGQDLHGTSAVLGYYRQLVYDDLRKQLTSIGITPQADAKSCWMDSKAANVNTWLAPVGCTGFEMLATPSLPTTGTTWQDALDVTPEGITPRTIFRPGDPLLTFISDPKNAVTPDPNVAGGLTVAAKLSNNFVSADNLLQASLQQVTAIMGHGNVKNLPPAVRDWRYFLQFWARAFTKYLLNRSKNPTWRDLYADDSATPHTLRQVNADNLFFDLFNGLDKFEYIDRDPAQQLGAPIDFEYDILLSTSNTQDNNFFQRLERSEKALYTSMLADKTKVPGGNENVFLSDLFGAPAIANSGLFAAAKDASSNPVAGKDAYYCATHLPSDADCLRAGPTNKPPSDAHGPLLDGIGRPLFTNYKGIFAGTAFSIGNEIPIKQTVPLIANAIINLPNYADPYDTTSANTPISVLVPWIPPQPSNGFEIPINAQRSQFIPTGSFDFSGVTITMNVDYTVSVDAKGTAHNTIAAVETQDFLGEVFPCVDKNTGDILRVKMYSSVLDILNWFDTHPGSRTACNIFVRTSPYNNYPDYIVSLTNGVLLSVNPGAGGGPGRIADATLFNPGLLTQTQ